MACLSWSKKGKKVYDAHLNRICGYITLCFLFWKKLNCINSAVEGHHAQPSEMELRIQGSYSGYKLIIVLSASWSLWKWCYGNLGNHNVNSAGGDTFKIWWFEASLRGLRKTSNVLESNKRQRGGKRVGYHLNLASATKHSPLFFLSHKE